LGSRSFGHLQTAKMEVDSKTQEADVSQALSRVKHNIVPKTQQLNLAKQPQLIAISKTKPNNLIMACYKDGHRQFGENYVQELLQKATELPVDIEWHFVGNLQSNKVKSLLEIPNLEMIQSVDSLKLAKQVNKNAQAINKKQKILVQINTSAEDSKGGISPNECVSVVSAVLKECANIHFCGLMTIGNPELPPEKDFETLAKCKKEVCDKLGLAEATVELSMGMSHDYEKAIEMGSTIVRVGSSIFGERTYANK